MSLDDIIGEGEGEPPREADGSVLLSVPFDEKDDVKNVRGGARWDPQKKTWYVPSTRNPTPFKRWWALPPLLRLEGEDREFGGNHLFSDLIPASTWFTNVRYCVEPKDWFRLRKFIYERAKLACEICGNKQGGLEAHERWEYQQENSKQILRRLICLCSACHEATHMGLAEVRGNGERAEAHIAKVNGWSREDVKHHIDDAYETWLKRNTITWELDLNILHNTGIKTIKQIKAHERAALAETMLKEERKNRVVVDNIDDHDLSENTFF